MMLFESQSCTAYPAFNANLGFCFFESTFSVDFNIVISAHPGVKLFMKQKEFAS